MLLRLLVFSIATMASLVACADDATFQTASQVLAGKCVKCHQGEHPQGELQLSTNEGIRRGGESGAAITAGDADASLLIDLITGDDPSMPKGGKPLSAEEVVAIKDWINAGALWPEGLTIEDTNRPSRDWWSFKPIVHSDVPPSAKANPIDAFVQAKLAESKLQPSAEADRRTLIRRLSFDLLGLPPTPEEVAAFCADADPQAYEKLVDRLLASPHYGERWARHWLDIAHYADTHGFERDQRRDNAWRYRDYVIRALNADKPYDQFLQEQLAGDAMRADDAEAIVATGFLAAGPWDFVGQAETMSDVLRRAARADDLDDMVTQVMTASTGMTINCARCHDHKLDPISQREYFSLVSVFAGVKRGDRPADPLQSRQLAERKQSLESEKSEVALALARLSGTHLDLADLVGGGNGLGTGKRGQGIDALTGRMQAEPRNFLENVVPNQFAKANVPGIDGVVIPDASAEGTPISSTGLLLHGVPKTSAQVWDAIRNGPVNSQFTTKLAGVEYGGEDHSLLSIHANAAITFDLEPLRKTISAGALQFTAKAGYFGQTPRGGASYYVYVDGELAAAADGIGHDDGPQPISISLPSTARFLTLLVTDHGNGISHDQISFIDAWLNPEPKTLSPAEAEARDRFARRAEAISQELASLPSADAVYAIQTETPPKIRIHARGNPEDPQEEVAPATLECAGLPATLGSAEMTDGERRMALAKWIVDPANPLTARVAVNRLWHYHFGTGIVDTPSDFGRGGGLPSHPELLDWLANELVANDWSLKAMHRLICTSDTYRQQSQSRADAAAIDGNNRLLWRMNPRRLDAEAVRDSILSVSGSLNKEMFGPGYRDFDYQEEYAPVYRYVTPDSKDLWRRTIYRFVVRTTPNTLLNTLDCANPANLSPTRNVTTTALQSLALLNNDFVLRQSEHFAENVQREVPDNLGGQVTLAFARAFARQPRDEERQAAIACAKEFGFKQLCRTLFNANEFVYVD